MIDLSTLVLTLVVVAFVILWKNKLHAYLVPRKIKLYFNMYPSRGIRYWPKRSIMKFLIKLKRYREQSASGSKLYDSEKMKEYRESEKLHLNEDNSLSIDSTYFFGTEELQSNSSNRINQQPLSFIIRLARRSQGVAEFWILLRQPDGSLLTHPNAPLTLHRDYSQTAEGQETWSVDAGCTILCLSPMERWKVKFTGFLKKAESNGDPDTLTHVDFNVTFRAFTNPVDVDKDLSPNLIADAIAREEWSKEFFAKLESQKQSENQKHIEQWGAFDGSIVINNGESRTVTMRGYRDHSYGLRSWSNYHRYVAHFAYLEDGSCFSVGSVCMPNSLRHLRYGYFFTPYGKLCPITWHNVDLWNIGEYYPPQKQYRFSFKADGKRYDVQIEAEDHIEFKTGENLQTLIFERFAKYRVNQRLGYGVNEFCYGIQTENGINAVKKDRYNSIKRLVEPIVKSSGVSLISFDDLRCQQANLVGGKACQLSALSTLHGKIQVPNGFVLTTEMYTEFLQANPQLSSHINDINISHELRTQAWKNAEFPSSMSEAIFKQAQTVFGEKWEEIPVAVRSSATGEDGGSASAAGQMETYLGILGKKQLLIAIRDCWASQFSEHATSYRRENGLQQNPTMAVIIQRLVKAYKSGVIFTQDPRNGDSGKLIINAAFGLAESIVSGENEPDTYTVKRLPNDLLQIDEIKIGTKQIRTITKADGGVENVASHTDNTPDNSQCLSFQEIQDLSETAIMIEVAYSSPRDIEWAIGEDGKVYILQARPITSLHQDTEYDLLHEFDSSISYGKEVLTTANIGEMMPAAVTPLTMSVFADAIDKSLQTVPVLLGQLNGFNHPRRHLPSFNNHLFINIQMMGLFSQLHIFSGRLEMVFLALLGRILEKPTLNDIEYFTGRTRIFRRIKNFFHSTVNRLYLNKKTAEWETRFRSGYSIDNCENAEEQLLAIESRLDEYYRCWRDTVSNSGNSAIWSMIVLKILDEQETWSNDVFAKVAHLLSSCENVYSADVPSALQNLAKTIAKSQLREEFLQKDVESATAWILSSESGNIGRTFTEFLKRHGHRCVRESEFRETSWNASPSKVVSVLKSIVETEPTESGVNNDEEKSRLSVQEAIDSLDVQLSPLKKRILQWILPRARRGVAQREWGKSLSIEMVNHFKEAYKHLGKLATKEEIIPDLDLIYFFTHGELMTMLVENKQSKGIRQNLIAKAQKRRRILDIQMAQMFPETLEGSPLDVDNQKEDEIVSTSENNAKLTGLTVSRGAKRGIARVVRTLNEAKEIQKGEILIVPFTDIGWTPYFPLISGLVTEKGGLLSHGAVVAREFGLPCIVGAQGATSIFKTGDRVFLNSSKGFIEKCE